MGFWRRFRDAWRNFWNGSETTTLTLKDKELAQWLGIDPSQDRLSEVTYFTCLMMMAETIGKLPLKYYQTTEEGKIRADPDDMTRLLTIRPNPVMTPTALFTACEINCQHYGNGYIWIQRQVHIVAQTEHSLCTTTEVRTELSAIPQILHIVSLSCQIVCLVIAEGHVGATAYEQ